MKRLALTLLLLSLPLAGQLTGKFVTPMTGQPLSGATLTLTLNQAAVVPGTYAIAPTTVTCATSSQGLVVGIADPSAAPSVSTNTASGSLTGGTYFVKLAYIDGSTVTLASPETPVILSATGSLVVSAPAAQPTAATGYEVFIGSTSGGETLQGTITGTPGAWAGYTQSAALASGTALPASNTTVCAPAFNDALTPTTTYYTALLADSAGDTVPGYPANWRLTGSTVDVSTILPLGPYPYVNNPTPILATPSANSLQSISGPLSLAGYRLEDTANVGPGYISAFIPSSSWSAPFTVTEWTPASAITVQRFSAFAQTAGSGGTAGLTFQVTDSFSTCSGSGMLPATGTFTSVAASGTCSFSAGIPLILKISSDDHSVKPSAVNALVEVVSQ